MTNNTVEFSKKEISDYKKGIKTAESFSLDLSKTFASTTKQILWLFMINGILWIWCSYVLAFIGRDQIAEALSSNVCSVVIGQMGFYLVTKTVENLSKFNPYLNGTAKRAINQNIKHPMQDEYCDDIPTEETMSDYEKYKNGM